MWRDRTLDTVISSLKAIISNLFQIISTVTDNETRSGDGARGNAALNINTALSRPECGPQSS